MSFDVLDLDGRKFCLVRGSDIERDGMFLELEDCGTRGAPLAEVFYSDTEQSFITTVYDDGTPRVALAWLETQARRLLPLQGHSPESAKSTDAVDHKAELLRMIIRLLDESWDVPRFERAYHAYYLDTVPDSALTEQEHEFFGLIQERLDWTHPNPDPESRRFGWQDHIEYRKWVADLMKRFADGEPLEL